MADGCGSFWLLQPKLDAEADSPAEAECARQRELWDLIVAYQRQHGRFPARLADVGQPDARDSWQQPYVYGTEGDAQRVALYSIGPDGVDNEGGGGDVFWDATSRECVQ